jgi:ubiquinone/menaquinone biosynthesis C-methylase UbiE
MTKRKEQRMSLMTKQKAKINQSQKTYNRIAECYDQKDFGSVYKHTRHIYCKQITETIQHDHPNILDLSVGTGNALDNLKKHYPKATFTGNDLSKNMLKKSQEKMQDATYSTILDDVNNITRHIKRDTQDLILCHYLFSYADRIQVMRHAYQMLKPGGYLSIASTTKKQFSSFHEQLKNGQMGNVAKLFTHSMNLDPFLEQVGTPKSKEQLIEEATSLNFKLIKSDSYLDKLYFLSFQDMKSWAYDSGWAANYFEQHPKLKLSILHSMYTIGTLIHKENKMLSANSDIALLLLQKPHNDTTQ